MSVVEAEGLKILLNGRRNIAVRDGRGLHNWWMGLFYVNGVPEVLEEYEFLGEKVMIGVITLNQKKLVFINMSEYRNLFGSEVIQIVCSAYRIKMKLGLVY
jgi:hypothetical protein